MAGSGTAHLRDERCGPVLRAEHLMVEFPTRRGRVHAVSDVSIDLVDGETLGIVGESGCGKSTIAKAIMRVPPPDSGRVLLGDTDLAATGAVGMRDVRSRLQMVFQDPVASLNPRHRIGEIVTEPLTVRWLESFRRSPVIRLWERYVPAMLRWWRHPLVRRLATVALVAFLAGLMIWVVATAAGPERAGGTRDGGIAGTAGNAVMLGSLAAVAPIAAMFAATTVAWLGLVALIPLSAVPRWVRIRRGRRRFREEAGEKVRRVLEDVGIDPGTALDRRPHEFSGGQAQRISLARALITEPEVIICDEPVSALDVSVQAQVLNLLKDLKDKYGISLIFIAHDLAVVKNISDRVVVMYLGKICEVASPDDLFARPHHPYTRVLVNAIPVPDPAIDPRAAPTTNGEIPSPLDPPSGCRFRTRCPQARPRCAREEPEIQRTAPGRYVACHYPATDPDPAGAPRPEARGVT
ncbi:oligopeptide/dipeptide ABC transporter ATP-binding protein [Actinomadura sp. 3N407]|uniref:oligopeptide/dipeptide ABC transporter ATP-binding protein n=1 Tax=Actinomadura sp. 3N407 TaxID=3457423 RepID=UPI003FCD5F6E